jgi:hypothetical protein
MSKVKKEVIEAAALKLLSDITMTMPTPTYKFLLGSISAVATMNNGQKIHEILGLVADNEGYVFVRAYVPKEKSKTESMYGWVRLTDLVKQNIFEKKNKKKK